MRFLSTFSSIILLLALIAAAWALIRYVRRSFRSISAVRPRAQFLFRVLETVLQIAVWFGVLASAARLLAPGENTVLVLLGSAVLAAGLGARELIGNLLGGLFMVVNRPYEVGDRVSVDGVTGDVRRNGLGTTKIVTQQGAVATVPHARLLSGIAQNDTPGSAESKLLTQMFLSADADPDIVLRVGREALIASPYLCLRRPIAATLAEGLARVPYLKLKLEGYVYDHHCESEMQTDLLRRCRAEFRRVGIPCVGTTDGFDSDPTKSNANLTPDIANREREAS